jgi:hypothetical protein
MADYKQYFSDYKKYKVWIADKCLEKSKLIKEQLENKIPSVKAQRITDMPVCHGDDPSPVTRFLIQSEEKNENLQQKIDLLQTEIDQYVAEVQAIDSRLAFLKDIERFVLDQYYIQGLEDWTLVQDAFQCRYKRWISDKQLRRIRNEAMDKLLNVR